MTVATPLGHVECTRDIRALTSDRNDRR